MEVDLDRLVAELRAEYGDELRAIVLHGSQVRGDAFDDSDVDVAVLLQPGIRLMR